MPAAFTAMRSVQVPDFENICLLIQHGRLVCDFCSSGQRFACGFLQIPPRGGHPCRPANTSPCRACRGLSPPSGCAMPGAQTKKGPGLSSATPQKKTAGFQGQPAVRILYTMSPSDDSAGKPRIISLPPPSMTPSCFNYYVHW